MNNEPVLSAVTVGAIVAAALQILVVFGVNIQSDQVEAILTAVAVIAPVVLSAIYARSKVTPTDPTTRR